MLQLLQSLTIPRRFADRNASPELKSNEPPSNAAGGLTVPPVLPRKSIEKKKAMVLALYDFPGQESGDLPFHKGDKIEVIERKDNVNDWWTGSLNGITGQFPGKKPSN